MLENQPGYVAFQVRGQNCDKLFYPEAGAHSWKRIPPTERKGRVHTSVVTVAILKEPDPQTFSLNFSELTIRTSKGSGPGGQHKNTTESAVEITHKPTSISVYVSQGRSQHQNKKLALSLLSAKISELKKQEVAGSYNQSRKHQIGSGQRGSNKIRSIFVKNHSVVDHRNGKKIDFKRFSQGHLEDLH